MRKWSVVGSGTREVRQTACDGAGAPSIGAIGTDDSIGAVKTDYRRRRCFQALFVRPLLSIEGVDFFSASCSR